MELPKTINKSKSGKGAGFTLIELLVYLAIFAIAAGLLSGILAVFIRVQSQEAAGAELTQQLSFVQSTVQRLVREAVNIQNQSGPDYASSTLILRMASPSLDPTIIFSDANAIYLRQGTGAVNPLTSSRVRVASFQVVKYENPGAHAIVQLDFSLTYNSQRAYQQITRGLKTAIGRVTAANFDDSLLPNTVPNSFTIGNPTYPWKSLTLSNILNLGQLTTDPVDGQNGSIYYNSVDNAFRGYKAGSWQNLGEGFWTATSTAIYNTNSGNVGIGTANPLVTLDIANPSSLYLRLGAGTNADNAIIFRTGTVDKFVVGQRYQDENTFRIQHQADWGVTQSGFFLNNGKVGIGTANPLVTLDIANPSSLYLRLGAGTNADNAIIFRTGTVDKFVVGQRYQDENTFRIQHQADWGVTQSGFFLNNGKVGIGTTGPSSLLHVGGLYGGGLTIGDAGYVEPRNNHITFSNSDTSPPGFIGHSRMDFEMSTNTKRGVSQIWQVPFDIAKNSWNLRFGIAPLSSEEGFHIDHAPATAGTPVFVSYFTITEAGNVGIGTTGPSAKLHVVQSSADSRIELSNSTGVSRQTLYLSFDDIENEGYLLAYDYGASAYLPLTLKGSYLRFMNGNVGIGTPVAPTYQLQLSTDSAAKPGTNTWTVSSDARIKTDTRPFTDGLNTILGINPVWYKYNGLGGFTVDGKDNIGVIAQDIQKVAPYTVSSYYDKLNASDATTTKLLNFNSGALTFTTINAIKELNNKIEALEKRIEILETK